MEPLVPKPDLQEREPDEREPGEHEAEPAPELVEESRIGSTPAGQAANDALRALSRAARSFLINEPNNDAIRAFIESYRDTMRACLAFGPLDLEVRPFELVYDGEVVYLERDRERSLAFRMYRDGVRRLTIQPEVEWEELLRLLEILSIRYVGVRQQEDDIVTLLFKAGFQSIDVRAVEGFTPDEEYENDGTDTVMSPALRHQSAVDAPRDWDLPLPRLLAPGEVQMRTVAPLRLQALADEVSSVRLPDLVLRLVSEMLGVASDPTDPTTIADVLPLADETRGFLLAEGQLARLLDLARLLAAFRDLDAERVDALLLRFTDAQALRRILHSISADASEVPEELVGLLDLVPQDHLDHLIELLETERRGASRRIARQLIERYLDPKNVAKRLTEAPANVAGDLLRALLHALPDRRLELARLVVARPEIEIQREIRFVLDHLDPAAVPPQELIDLLGSPSVETRRKAIALIEARKDPRTFRPLMEHVESLAVIGSPDTDELTELGRALASLDPERALPVLSDWVRPRSLWNRLFPKPSRRWLEWAGVAGLGRLPGEKPEKLIRWLADRAGEDLVHHCLRTLARRRREGIRDDG